MIQTRNQYEVTSTVPTDNKVAMSIRAEDMAHIMGVLTDLYSNKLLAIIREYSTNALDAQVEAGVNRAIEVELPSAMTPFLTVRDFGVGLNEESIRDIYSQYGRSTKRDSNSVVGMLGLGCKSALTYTSQFTVTSVKDGVRTVVVISREADGSGSMTPLSADLTSDANGTEVRIPVSRGDHYAAATVAESFFSYWPEGSVLVDGVAPKRFEGIEVTDSIFATSEYSNSKIVMGNVAYPAPQLDDLGPSQSSVVAHVPIGSVDFPPSRESLMDTQTTRATIEQIKAEYAAGVGDAIQTAIDAGETLLEGIQRGEKAMRRLVGKVNWNGLTYRGNSIVGAPFWGHHAAREFIMTEVSSSTPGRSHARDYIPVSLLPKVVWVENYTPNKFNVQHKRKLNHVLDEQVDDFVDYAGHTYALVDGKINREHLPAEYTPVVLDWEEVAKVRLAAPAARRRSASSRIPGSYDVVTETGTQTQVKGDDLQRTGVPIFWFHGNWQQFCYHYRWLSRVLPKFTVVTLGANRIEKFKRDVPAAKEFTDQVAIDAIEAKAASFPDEVKEAWALQQYGRRYLASLDPLLILDPDLREYVRKLRLDVSSFVDFHTALPYRYRVQHANVEYDDDADLILARYPLLDTGTDDTDHLHAYLNWCYESAK